MSDINEQKRVRRTNKQLEIDGWNTLEQLVQERGFNGIPLTLFAKEAGLSANVFYRHYGTMEAIYETLANRHMSGLIDILSSSDTSNISEQEACDLYTKKLKMLFKNLKNDKIMQQLLLWELSEDNSTTRKTSLIREKVQQDLVSYSKGIFKASGTKIEGITALLLAGIYYTTICSKPICTINCVDSAGRAQLSKGIDEIIGFIFDQQNKRKYRQEVIERMQKYGIPKTEIAKYLGVSEKEIERLSKK